MAILNYTRWNSSQSFLIVEKKYYDSILPCWLFVLSSFLKLKLQLKVRIASNSHMSLIIASRFIQSGSGNSFFVKVRSKLITFVAFLNTRNFSQKSVSESLPKCIMILRSWFRLLNTSDRSYSDRLIVT